MSTTIDERVVEMRFDNRQFEQNVQTSLSTLDKLKQGLDLDGAAKGLEGLGTAAKKCDLSTLSNSVETVRAKFSALEVMAMTALSNITNSAVNAGKRMLSSFTVEPISTGFNEYELKMGSIQTIMASTGESLDKVNQKLDELNTYSDRTIYSFADMTSNIGKFTNAGVKLDDAVAAIQGVSNVAAVSGANANEASRAMYNFAQALSAGYVKLIDWKSIENANMATVEFKTQLLEAAVAAGTVEKSADGMYKVLTKNGQGGVMKETIDATHMFNDSLAYQWMTTEVLTETLKDYADETTEFGEWQDILDKLSARGLDSDLIGELQQMGPDAISQIKALNSMSDSELEKYASLWSVKHAQAREQAVGELEGLRIETQNNIAQLRVEADQELEEYRSVWQSKMAQVTADANAELERLRKEFGEKVGLIKTNTEDDLKEMSETAQKILREAGWDETGKQIVTGLTGGVQSERSSFIDELTNMALAGVEAVKTTLDINSPSRVFRELGNFTGLGFVNGLNSYVEKSYDVGSDMAESAKSGLSNVLQTVADIVSGGIEIEPTIRPVLDLSNVASGVDTLDSLFYSQRAIGLAGQASVAFSSSRSKGQPELTVNNSDVVAELKTLRGEMAAMVEKMERMRVVLDTGVLVGEMAAPMDAALGQRATYKGRGN